MCVCVCVCVCRWVGGVHACVSIAGKGGGGLDVMAIYMCMYPVF